MSEIQEYKKSNWLTNEEKSVIDRQFFPQGATVDDKRYCMQVAEAFGLNPILKQIYFVPRKTNIGTQQNPNWVEKVEPIAGRDSYLTLAHRTGQFAGIESYVKIENCPTLDDKGKWILEEDLVAYATVYKKGFDKPFIVSVRYAEYAQKTNNGNVTKFWKEKPETMLKKVAESQVLRKAFNITGLYDESELGDNETILTVNNEAKVSKPKSLNDLQVKDINYSVEVLNNMIKANIPESKAKEYLSNKSNEEIKQLFDDEDLFQNECMDLIL